MSNLDDPIVARTMEMALDYHDKADLVAKLEEMTTAIKNDDSMVTYDHPEWLRTKWQCCGGSGP